MSWGVAQTSWDGVPLFEKHVHTCTRRTHWIMWKVIRRLCTTVAIVMREQLGAVLGLVRLGVVARARDHSLAFASLCLHLYALGVVARARDPGCQHCLF